MESPIPFAEEPDRAALALEASREAALRADWPEIFGKEAEPAPDPARFARSEATNTVLSPDRHAPDDAPPPGPAALADASDDTRRLREDGWTSPRRAAFLAALAETGIVTAACRKTGMSATSAYALRSRDRRFADGWDAAGLIARARLADALADRAINGCVEQIWRDGCIVGERHRHDNRLSMAVLRRLDARCDARVRGPAQRLVDHWDDYLTATDEGRDDDAAALAVAPPEESSAKGTGPVRGVGSLTTLQRQLVHLRAGYALDEDETTAAAFAQSSAAASPATAQERVWDEGGVWLTDFPPPDDFDGVEYGDTSTYNYYRECSSAEAAAMTARHGPPVDEEAEELAEEEAERDAFFAELAQPVEDPSPLEGEGRVRGPAASAAEKTPSTTADTVNQCESV